MTKFHKLFISKAFAVLLTLLLFHGSYYYSNAYEEVANVDKNLAAALEDYQAGLYEAAAKKLEQLLPLIPKGEPELKVTVFLVLAASYEKLKKEEIAGTYYRRLKKILDNGQIDRVPVVPGIEPESLPGYREVFEETSLITFKNPVAVAEIMDKNVVHAPRKSIEQKNREKKKKKFPWLIAIGAVVVIGTAAVLLLTSKSGDPIETPDIVWVHIPAGEFFMGDSFNEGDPDELPVHKVDLDAYYISRYEVTYDQYILFCDDTGRARPAPFNPGRPYASGTYPIAGITWHDANEFCEWLSARTGERIKLPTEAQWEKAARGANPYRYPWGDTPPDCSLANYYDCGENGLPAELRPVGSCSAGASSYTIPDMAGNVAEWCRDIYSSTYYSESSEKNPYGPTGGSTRIVRGGSIQSQANGLRIAKRSFLEPSSSKGYIGFRIVKEL